MTHADGWTDMKKLIVAFHSSITVPKKLVKIVRLNCQALNIKTVLKERHVCSVQNHFQQQTCLQMAVTVKTHCEKEVTKF